jgi:very-short-patch-repair endonuclease
MATIVAERVERWKKKLIDLTKRNRLIGFKSTKVTTIHIVDEQSPEVFSSLVVKGKTMDFLPLPAKSEREQASEHIEIHSKEFKKYDRNHLSAKHTDIHLQTNVSKEQLPKSLFRINSSSVAVMEEQGYNILFLAMGFLEWYESAKSDVKIKSPLVLVPVELSRPSVKEEYNVRYNEDAVLMNPALQQRLKLDFGIHIDDLDDDIDKINLFELFTKIQKKIKSKKRWRVTNDIFLGLFSFAKFMMYKDIEANLKHILKNRVIQSICGQETGQRKTLDSLCSWDGLKELIKPHHNFQVLDADSSQQRAIAIVKKGNNLVIEGPPGTGKSQTITNIIAELLAENKKVLFVSQKMAALEVVKKRLEAAGLGDFCLELHSKKTNKRRVIEELAASLVRSQSPDHKRDHDLARLEHVKEALSRYMDETGSPFGKLNMTPFKAIGILASMAEMPDLEYLFKNVQSWDEKKFVSAFELLEKISDQLAQIKNPSLHAWYGSKLTNLSYQNKVKIKKLMASCHEAHIKLQDSMHQLAGSSFFKKPDKYKDVAALLEAANVLANIPPSALTLLKNKGWNTLQSKINGMVTHIKAFNGFKEWARGKYDLSILDEGIDTLHNEYKRHTGKSHSAGTSRIVRKYKVPGYKPTQTVVADDLKKICEGKKWSDDIATHEKLGKAFFGKLWSGRNSHGHKLDDFLNGVAGFNAYVEQDSFSGNIFAKVSNNEFDTDKIKTLRKNATNDKDHYINILEELFRAIAFDSVRGMGAELEDISIERLNKKIEGMSKSIEDIDSWLAYQSTLAECETFGLKEFLISCQKHNVAYESIPNMFKCQFLRCWIDEAFAKAKSLKDFRGINHEQLIEEFCELDCEQIELSKARLRHKLSGKIHISSKPEVGILQREARKRRAHRPLRKLFKEIPDILCELKPCLMMSPLTVAQFLDPKLVKFDVVIFDEASQIAPEDAVGTLIRGNAIVIAGDSKQLPPTSFFQSAVLTPEDDEELGEAVLMELDSVLDECVTSGFPECMLTWHYRSRHEHLIAFSNKHIYGANLQTFPSAENKPEGLGIKFHYMPEAHYERGKVGANLDEAKKVAQAVFEHFRKHPKETLGVATFNIRQKFAIQDAVEALRKQDHSLEEHFSRDKEEHFFVRNLETIQGDERDVIFISVGYGKTESGSLPMTFGPINQVGGERRLNVLVTRARRRVEIFSAIKGSDFDLNKTASTGVHLLKKYLDFAEKGETVLHDTNEPDTRQGDTPFEDAVYNALVKKGVNVKRGVGCSEYTIDLAVVDKKNPKTFLLGIECDGMNYRSSKTNRDGDRLRQQVLEQLGWTLCRIWSADWFRNPKQTLAKLMDEINKAQRGSVEKKISIKKVHRIDEPFPAEKRGDKPKYTIAYKTTPITGKRNSNSFYRSASIEHIINKFNLVVETEGPIHKDEAMCRVAQFWGFEAIGNRIKKRLQEVLKHCKKRDTFDFKGQFYWPKGMSTPPVRDRKGVEGINTKIDAISFEEIGEAGFLVLSKESGIPLDALVNQIAGLLGYGRVTRDMNHYIAKGVRTYKNSGHIVEKRNKLVLNKKKLQSRGQKPGI